MTPEVPEPVADDEVEALLAACRVLVAVSARSISAVDGVVDVTAFRVLVQVASQGSVTIEQLAEHLQVHPVAATRIRDRLLLANLLRSEPAAAAGREADSAPDSGRFFLSAQGQGVVHLVMSRRRAAIEPILAQLSTAEREALVTALRTLTAAAGEPELHDLWAMGWTH
jgi:DNA-binding MarR family transcriptional regulator